MRSNLFRGFTATLLCVMPTLFGYAYLQVCPRKLNPRVVVRFKPNLCSFSGSAQEQAKCLLRKVTGNGDPEPRPLEQLPAPLDRLVGENISSTEPGLTIDSFRRYLTVKVRKNKSGDDVEKDYLGGSVDKPLSKTGAGETAQYFIIHDVSYGLPGRSTFPANINERSWPGNNLDSYTKKRDPKDIVAHVFINRVGDSATGIDFGTAKLTTKYEKEKDRMHRVGLFLGVELVQPRLYDRRGNDSIAPNPGFTEAQLDRLALVYIAASLRKGRWLIPVFHADVDEGICGGHDDPRNFVLNVWAERLDMILREIRT